PDPGAPLVEILDPGANINVVETDEELPADFVKIALDDGRIGYVRLREVEAAIGADASPTRREPIGCITPVALVAVMALLIVTAIMMLLIALRSDEEGALYPALACLIVVPSLIFVVGFYLYVRKREEELLSDDDAVREPGVTE